MERGDIQYATAGDIHVAYREMVGDPDSDLDVVMVCGGFFSMEILPQDPIAARLVEGLAALGRLVLFDRRGIGLSDQIVDWETNLLDQWVDDLTAVVEAAGCERPSVFSWHQIGIGRTFAARHPDRIDRLVLFNPRGPLGPGDEEWVAQATRDVKGMIARESGSPDGGRGWPHRWQDPAFREWLDAAGRSGASPSQAARLVEAATKGWKLPVDHAGVSAPTLVLTRHTPGTPTPREVATRVASVVPNATHVALPDGDIFPVGADVDGVLAEISRFLTGRVQLPAPERELRAIMFTDLVDSTRRAATEGDARWRALLDRHDELSRVAVERHGGAVVKSTGDGILALLPSVTAALGAAREIRDRLGTGGLPVRLGIHAGEVDDRGGDASGFAVHMAARIMSEAEPGQILVSDIARQVGAVATVAPVGDRPLKGSDETWSLFEVT